MESPWSRRRTWTAGRGRVYSRNFTVMSPSLITTLTENTYVQLRAEKKHLSLFWTISFLCESFKPRHLIPSLPLPLSLSLDELLSPRALACPLLLSPLHSARSRAGRPPLTACRVRDLGGADRAFLSSARACALEAVALEELGSSRSERSVRGGVCDTQLRTRSDSLVEHDAHCASIGAHAAEGATIGRTAVVEHGSGEVAPLCHEWPLRRAGKMTL